MIRKGQPFALIIFIITIIIIGVVISLISEPFKTIYNKTYNNSDIQDEASQNFLIRMRTVWYGLPVVAAFGMIAWFFYENHKRQNEFY